MNELISIFTNVVKNNYLNFKGRARRKEYWMYMLGFGIIYVVLMILMTIFGLLSSTLASIFGFIFGIVFLVLAIPSIALGFRRMQDVGKPGWFMFIPIYNIILAVTEGTRGDNEYGPDPKAQERGF